MSNKTLAEVREEYASTLAEDTKDREAKIRYNGAKKFLRQNLDEFEGDLLEAVKVLAGTGQRGGGGGANRVSPKLAVLKEIREAGSITAMDAFVKFNKGPAEMREMIKYGIREVEPENRVWITFENDTYVVVAEGPDAPEGWDSYLPADSEMDI